MTHIHVGRSVARFTPALQLRLLARDVTCIAIGAWSGYVAASLTRMRVAQMLTVEMKSLFHAVESAKCHCETDIDGVVQWSVSA